MGSMDLGPPNPSHSDPDIKDILRISEFLDDILVPDILKRVHLPENLQGDPLEMTSEKTKALCIFYYGMLLGGAMVALKEMLNRELLAHERNIIQKRIFNYISQYLLEPER
jgi:hypothetical protein